jgi:hypothetical protein
MAEQVAKNRPFSVTDTRILMFLMIFFSLLEQKEVVERRDQP